MRPFKEERKAIAMQLNSKVYDALKYVAQYVLPAAGTLYFALATIWGLPYGEQIVGTITAVDAFLGVLLGISGMSYGGDGVLKIDTSHEDKDIYRLDLRTDLDEIKGKSSVTLKVDPKARLQSK